MKYGWRERIIGAVILVALGAIFLPMLFDDPAPREQEPEPVMVIEQPVDGGETRQRIIESPQPPASVADSGAGQSNQPSTAVPEPDTSGQLSGGGSGFGQPSEGDGAPAESAPTGSQATEPRTDPIAEIAESESAPSQGQSATTSSESPAPAATPSRTPAASGGGWVVQVGSFGQSGNAERLTADLKSQGFPAYSKPRDNNLTTVYVGPYDSSDAGESARGELKQAANIQGLLIRNPSN
ncbi:SPOR domain-containing protein [Salinicola halophilus]|uniref:SPOR domain-containing protein n=1 Tax=Salinicola halophilus TaxID=184065 RepID=UPI000DA1121D|nr:SPOR domain-containing protein [Salinicola halophilus]